MSFPKISFADASFSSARLTSNNSFMGSTPGGSNSRRRKSLRESIDNSQLMNTVNTLATKVVSSNDR